MKNNKAIVIGKRKIIDSVDREILGVLESAESRAVTGSFISGKVNLSAPATNTRLFILQSKGIVKSIKGKDRVFVRDFGSKEKKIKSPCKVLWSLDIE